MVNRESGRWFIPATLLLLASWQPLLLYLVSLAIFGLPHVIWEAAFLRRRYAAHWPRHWWWMLGAILLAQAVARTAFWMGTFSSEATQIVDLLSLLMLGAVIVFAPADAGWNVRIAGLLLSGAMLWLLHNGAILEALLALAILHNFTPLAMAWDMARHNNGQRRLAWRVTALFVLPLLLVCGLWGMPASSTAIAGHAWLLDGQLPANWGGAHRSALLSAIVLSQCLHYYCVIVLLPRAEKQHPAPLMPPWARAIAIGLTMLICAYYVFDYEDARKLYAVASGMHAWVEWPVLLMALLGARPNPRLPRTS
ncbi:hypothetical protein [Herbaspirillum sp.]|uniref:hypothetical protein n=1 Tax=Herbaspirillum sp. TaxID=1890675 RepID=UPI001B2158CC|nr:hypothetical protein [Herbaspirillum sp.]MBO9538076.1 hypothetical protein [Herbaspirillum sp.]